jgi:hypothetical protein
MPYEYAVINAGAKHVSDSANHLAESLNKLADQGFRYVGGSVGIGGDGLVIMEKESRAR